MKTKTIKTLLRNKHNEFLASIKDEKVRDLVHKNSIVTGGCIVSMLLGEKVNDYDYYFANQETVHAVAQYYVEEYKKLNPDSEFKPYVKVENGRVKIHIQSKGVAYDSELMKEVKYFDHGYRTDDLEFDLEEVIDTMRQDKNDYRPIFMTANAITLSNKVQLVIRFFGDPEEIHENYDFIHCTCYYLPHEHKLVLPAKALESIITRELRYMGSKYPICSIIRTRKFIKKNWTINGGQYLKMAFQVNELNLEDLEVLEDQLIGVDAYYFQQLIKILREKKEKDSAFSLGSNYLAVIIDKIF